MNHFISNRELATIDTGRLQIPLRRGAKSVLLVCWCNVCRSPACEAILKRYLKRRDLSSKIYIDSAGVCVDDEPPSPSLAMRWATFRRGYRWGRKEPRPVRRTDLIKFDLVIAMDQRVLNALRPIHSSPKSEIKLLSDFLPANWAADVPDPMNQSALTCNRVLDMLEMACPVVVNELLQRSSSPKACRTGLNNIEKSLLETLVAGKHINTVINS